MEFSKYIVPIYATDGYRGNGFIVNGFLILPYHLLKVSPNKWEVFPSFYFQYDGDEYYMETATHFVRQGHQKDVENNPNNVRDLLIFKINICDSDLTLSLDFDVKEQCLYYGYNEDDRGILKKEILAMGFIHQQCAVSLVNGLPVELENCMTCICKFEPGHSGGLVCQNDSIIGMFIRDQSFHSGAFQSMFIKASYILQTIENDKKE